MPVVTLYVGDSMTKFHVHSRPLCDVSGVFKAAFSEDATFKEGSERSIRMPDEDLVAVGKMVQVGLKDCNAFFF